jgi:hypothetical protein
VEVILVTPPVWPEYRKRMRSDYWGRAQSDFEFLHRQYGVRYLSFLDTPELGPQDFLDADHLNGRGAVRFTKLLSAALEKPHDT